MSYISLLAPASAVMALLFSGLLAIKVIKEPQGNEVMRKISSAIKEGANTYLKVQYRGVGIFFAVMFVVLGLLAWRGFLTPFVPFAFVSGGFFSGLSGYIGMKIATAANARTADAAMRSLNSGLNVAFSSGAVMGFVVVGLGLLDISIWFFFLNY